MGVMKRCVTWLENFPDTPLLRHRGWHRSAAERKTLLPFWTDATDSPIIVFRMVDPLFCLAYDEISESVCA